MWKEANGRGGRCQWKYREESGSLRSTDCKRKKLIFNMDLLCPPSPHPVKIHSSLPVVPSKAGALAQVQEVICRPDSPFPLVSNGLVRRMALQGGKEQSRVNAGAGWSTWPGRASMAGSRRAVPVSLDVACIKHLPKAVHQHLPP